MISNPAINEAHARCAAQILRFTSMTGAQAEDIQVLTEFTSRLLYGESVDYSMLLSAQEELIRIGGEAEQFDTIRRDLLH